MKYNISLGGRGSDCRIFRVSDEEFQYLKENGVEEENLEYEEICDYLQKELLFDEADEYVVGPYLDELYLVVQDEDKNVIFESESMPDDVIDNSVWESCQLEGENYFVIEDYSKGNFFSFEVENENFDINKLSFIVKEIAESRDFIVGLKYDGVDLTDTKEYGDYWSKGLYYLLSQKWNRD
jgi:hypothetical protein